MEVTQKNPLVPQISRAGQGIARAIISHQHGPGPGLSVPSTASVKISMHMASKELEDVTCSKNGMGRLSVESGVRLVT